MSYNDYDILRQHVEEDGDFDWSPLLETLRDYHARKNAERIWYVADDWDQDHAASAEDAPDYVRGVYRGLIIAAKELEGLRS